MSAVNTSITIDAPVKDVWSVALDPWRLGDWVTIHRKVHSAPKGKLKIGDEIEQTMALRGAPFKVTWRITELSPPHTATWEGRGPAGSKAITTYRLEPAANATEFHYTNEFIAPGGVVGRVAASALVGGLAMSEAQSSLVNLQELLEPSEDAA